MKDLYMLNYSVKGIKNLDKLVSLSFYKKTITKNMDTQEYNIKGIYGMNGSGKSGIVTSVEILRKLLTDSGYLSNPIAQKNLDAIVNRRTGELYIEVDYVVKVESELFHFRYSIMLKKDITGKFVIASENLFARKATSKSEEMSDIFKVVDGELVYLHGKEKIQELYELISNKTMNLLSTATMAVLFYEKILFHEPQRADFSTSISSVGIFFLYFLGRKLYVYLDQSDNHREYIAKNSLENSGESKNYGNKIYSLLTSYLEIDHSWVNMISASGNLISRKKYAHFEKNIKHLYEFLHIFKPDLKGILIDKKEGRNIWICDLVMEYENYKIHAEYESTGIKKLIQLFAYMKEMVQGGIVFIDEFDSNLHDVYLCALLEYLMEYGEGQLCFTTHNVGPMDVLKNRKKSIDFLSENHNIYSWTKNGNYSPSKLYRNGMIEGSPFNVDSIDFIGVFGFDEEDK